MTSTTVVTPPTGQARANYGIDAPGVVRMLSIAAIACEGLSIAIPRLQWLVWPAAFCAVEAVWMLYASKVGKLHKRDIILDGLHLRGDEAVLDIGCGRGLLLIGAAKRLENGRATGIDLWSQTDLSANSMEATLGNARVEGVEHRVDIETGDARALPMKDATFDAVVSSLALHNIPDAHGRAQAVREAVRVLKPGGQLVIQDIMHTAQYMETLEACGMEDVRRSTLQFRIFPPSRMVRAEKSATP